MDVTEVKVSSPTLVTAQPITATRRDVGDGGSSRDSSDDDDGGCNSTDVKTVKRTSMKVIDVAMKERSGRSS